MNNYSAKTEYACLAAIDLASSYGGEPVPIRVIAQNHGIPGRFLVQILLQLKAAGLVQSTRGPTGGYALSQPPERITLATVLGTIEGRPVERARDDGDGSAALRALRLTFDRAAGAQRELLESVTLADLAELAARQAQQQMYYI